MPIQEWPDGAVVVAIGDGPQFTDELNSLTEQLAQRPPLDLVLDMREVSFVDSSGISRLLKVRQQLTSQTAR